MGRAEYPLNYAAPKAGYANRQYLTPGNKLAFGVVASFEIVSLAVGLFLVSAAFSQDGWAQFGAFVYGMFTMCIQFVLGTIPACVLLATYFPRLGRAARWMFSSLTVLATVVHPLPVLLAFIVPQHGGC